MKSEYQILATIVILYAASCGSERLFQTLQFTFGLCGPLQLSSREAVVTDKCYNGGFFAGRLASIMAVKYMKPKSMLKSSMALCALSTVALSFKVCRLQIFYNKKEHKIKLTFLWQKILNKFENTYLLGWKQLLFHCYQPNFSIFET